MGAPPGAFKKIEKEEARLKKKFRGKYYNFFNIPNGTEGLLLRSSHALENTIQYLREGFAVRSFGVNRA